MKVELKKRMKNGTCYTFLINLHNITNYLLNKIMQNLLIIALINQFHVHFLLNFLLMVWGSGFITHINIFPFLPGKGSS